MPEQGDKKIYIGDIWADKDKYEYQKKFIEDILEVHQHHGYGLDADMVDGFHATDFATAEQGKIAESALQPFCLGGTYVDNSASYYTITTDATSIIERTLEAIPWDAWYNTPYQNLRDGEPWSDEEYFPDNLTEAIEFLYKLLQNDIISRYVELNNSKVDKSCVKIDGNCVKDDNDNDRMQVLSDNNFTDRHKAMVETLSASVTQVACYNCAEEPGVQTGTKAAINADTINGLQFILVTKTIYNNLPAACKSNWRNIFIFVEEIPPDYDSPLNCSFTNGFIFDIDDDRNYIIYKNKDATQWLDLISLSDLYTRFSSDLHNTIINTINNNGGAIQNTINDIIEKETVRDLLQEYTGQININDALSWPFIPNLLIDDFIYDAYILNSSNEKEYFPTVTHEVNGINFKSLNLTSIDSSIKEVENRIATIENLNLSSEINNINTNLGTLGQSSNTTAFGKIKALEDLNLGSQINNINNVLGASDSTDNNKIYGRINNIRTDLSALDERVTNLEDWSKQFNLVNLFVGRYSSRDSANSSMSNTLSRIIIDGYNASAQDSSSNPDGIYVRINNPDNYNAELNSDILDRIIINLSVKGMYNATNKDEWWIGTDNIQSTYDGIVTKNSTTYKNFRELTRSTNSAGEIFYQSSKIGFRWLEAPRNSYSTYLIEATPYYRGQICGKIVRIPFYIKRGNY